MIKSLICILPWFLGEIVGISGAKSGPYKSSVTRVGPCANPTPPVEDPPSSAFFAELYNTTEETNLMRGNISVYKENNRVKKVRTKIYTWEGSRWKVSRQINGLACKTVYFPVMAQISGLKYDANTCTISKGVYRFSNLNINTLQHIWMSSQEYGKVLWRFEVFSDIGSIFCYEYETLTGQIN